MVGGCGAGEWTDRQGAPRACSNSHPSPWLPAAQINGRWKICENLTRVRAVVLAATPLPRGRDGRVRPTAAVRRVVYYYTVTHEAVSRAET